MRKKFLVLGFGVSGRAAAQFLLKEGHSVIAVDRKAEEIYSDPEVVSMLTRGLTLRGEDVSLEGVSQIILSPGVPLTHPLIQKARERNIEVIGEVELGLRQIQNRCIGITASNGKTTTVLLVEHLLKSSGIKARALGNVGIGLSSYLLNPDPEEILVIELSSFQLESVRTRCLDLAVVLNITPNHLDRHPTMDDYVAAKLSIQNCLKIDGKLLVSKQVAREYGAFLKEYEVYDSEDPPLAPISSVRYGVPEIQNVRAAFAIAKQCGVKFTECVQGLETFRKPPHRIEWVADIDGVSYYNDSKSSNVHSVMHAVNLFEGPIVLIAGGTDKGSSYKPWIECFKGKVKQMIAYGAAAPKMEEELSGHFLFERRGPFREAVLTAMAVAAQKDTLILSPGCSSYDQFKSYEHRGDVFKQIVRERWIERKQF